PRLACPAQRAALLGQGHARARAPGRTPDPGRGRAGQRLPPGRLAGDLRSLRGSRPLPVAREDHAGERAAPGPARDPRMDAPRMNGPWPAPAKINLFLHVTGRRPDGYHELQTVFQFVEFGDSLEFEV